LVPSGLVPRIAELWRERTSSTGGAGAPGTTKLPVLKPKPD
jgi:hypothetical protein